MELESIITLANAAVRLRFLAMERSLRATGCTLPLCVIPYDDAQFPLPPGATWWEEPALLGWLANRGAHPTMRKYQCLLAANYQFADADVCFLRNPAGVLRDLTGVVTSCGHWHNPDQATTPASRAWLARHSTTWQQHVFNTGQWACDRALYTLPELTATVESPEFASTCLELPFHEQPGLNLLVNATGVPIQNLTLPPWHMQSTWAGDYGDSADYRRHWRSEAVTPYLIHWAGCPIHVPRPIDELFLGHLTHAERAEWQERVAVSAQADKHARHSARSYLRRWCAAGRAFVRTLRVESPSGRLD
jgi:hypothetical protein